MSETQNVPTLNIGDKSFAIDTLSEAAKAQISNLQIAEAEIKRLQNQLGLAQAAKNSFFAALQAEVAKTST